MFVPLNVTDLKVNGVALGNGSIALSQGRTDVHVFEPVSNEFALVSTPLSLEALELSAMADKMLVRASERVALDNLRSTIVKAVQFASSNPNAVSQPSVEAGMQQSLSLAIERVLAGDATATLDTTLASGRHMQLVRGVDEYLRLNPEAAVYSEDLARHLGVSVSTLKASVLAIRGMSIHRYLRLRRLWSVRRQLMTGVPGLTIKQSALANGFWHMGEFSSLYKAVFGESPSVTLARARGA
jgi:AraC family ethanolamine operon transcriptional activator